MKALALLLMFAGVADEDSGRIVGLADSPSERLSIGTDIYPGAPPVLSFRGFDASDRGRLSGFGLMTDDAGH